MLFRSIQDDLSLAQSKPPSSLANGTLLLKSPAQIWQELVGVAKYLSRTGKTTRRDRWCQRLDISDLALDIGLASLQQLGFCLVNGAEISDLDELGLRGQPQTPPPEDYQAIAQPFLAAIQEEQFRRRYFCSASSSAQK